MIGAAECLKIPRGLEWRVCALERHVEHTAQSVSGETHLPREGDGTGQYSASSFQAAKQVLRELVLSTNTHPAWCPHEWTP